MRDIKKIYGGSDSDKTVSFVIDEEILGLNKYNLLNEELENEIKSGIKTFTFDFTNLKSINSSGLGILISGLKKVKDSGCSLKIINASEKIIGIFKLTKLDNVFEFESST